MPLPKRYQGQVPEIVKIWETEGYFSAQLKIWRAECEARNKIYKKPNNKQLEEIKKALELTPKEIEELTIAKGHETNKLLRKIQGKLSSETGNYIHLGNTGSDVLDTSLSLQIIESLNIIEKEFSLLSKSLRKQAIKYKDSVQIGRTHGQHAVPQTFGRQVLGWYQEIQRGIERIQHAKKIISVGKISGEVGTHVFVESKIEEVALRILNLTPDQSSTQIISRDRHAEVVSLLAVNSSTLARIAENIRLLALTEIGEVREPFENSQQGSSAMPHKRNPELSERVIGLDRIIKSLVTAELYSTNVIFERDMSHSSTERFVFPDLFGNLLYMTRLIKFVIDGLEVFPRKMKKNLEKTYGAIYSSRLLNALIDSGKFSRTDAYDLVKELTQKAIDEEINLQTLAMKNKEIVNAIGIKELENLFEPSFYLRNIDVAYKRAGINK